MIINLLSGMMVIKKRKAQKAKPKEELMSIAWHPSRCWDWCVPEYEKKTDKKNCQKVVFDHLICRA